MKHLDPHAAEEDDNDHYIDEQLLIHRQRNDSFNSVDFEFPNRAEFRGRGKVVHIGGVRHRAISDATDDLATSIDLRWNAVEENESRTAIAPEVAET